MQEEPAIRRRDTPNIPDFFLHPGRLTRPSVRGCRDLASTGSPHSTSRIE
jgi:hypothetical protein